MQPILVDYQSYLAALIITGAWDCIFSMLDKDMITVGLTWHLGSIITGSRQILSSDRTVLLRIVRPSLWIVTDTMSDCSNELIYIFHGEAYRLASFQFSCSRSRSCDRTSVQNIKHIVYTSFLEIERIMPPLKSILIQQFEISEFE